ncbi:hypothetical protein Nmel_018486 [Mimus melanotis]
MESPKTPPATHPWVGVPFLTSAPSDYCGPPPIIIPGPPHWRDMSKTHTLL